MRIKQYRETDMRSAMRKVRDELGDDAVILSTARVDDSVELLAALDYDPVLAAELQNNLAGNAGRSAAGAAAQPAVRQAPAAAAPAAGANAERDPVIANMQAELSRLRGLFEEELAEISYQERGRRQPGRLALQNQLSRIGLGRELARDLLDAEPIGKDLSKSLRSVLERLASLIPVYDEDIIEEGGTFALLGPTGVGKTTTVAKIAARFALRHGRNQVALITTDRFRVGAQEQLYTFGSILGVPVQAASGADDLRKALASVADRKLVLIDTAGMSQRDMRLTDQFTALADVQNNIKCLLVLSGIAQQQVLQETLQSFSHIGLAGTVITKLDEAASLGPVISALCRHQVPLAFLGTGQRVPEDMLPGRAESLVDQAVRLARSPASKTDDGNSGGRQSG
ncbi:MAG: flagellar biosynthesis protein FlhF [Halieaceae bacterium]|nr:flagellar biosynthesis protein FlhF [Halieaceae bacterium]